MARGLTELLIKAGFADIRESKSYSTMIKSESPHTYYKEGRRNGNPWPCVKIVTLDNKTDEETMRMYHLTSKDVGHATKGKTIVLSEHRQETGNANRALFYVLSLADEAEA